MASNKVTVAEIIDEMRGSTEQRYCSSKHCSVKVFNPILDVADRIEAAHKREVAELCDALRLLAHDACGHCGARYCEEHCLYGEPKMSCRAVFDALQTANRFDPPSKPQTEDDDMPF